MKFLFVITLLATTALNAQIDTRVNSPAGPSSGKTDAGENENAASQGPQPPERRPALSGLEILDDGVLHDQLSVSGQIIGLADSNSPETFKGAHSGLASQVGGQAKLQHSWRQASLLAEYSGNVGVGGQNQAQNYEDAGLSQMLWHGRWHFMAGGHITFLPESDFGFNALRSIPDANVLSNSSVVPAQTVFTRPSTQLHESATSEVDYLLDRSSSIFVYGTYSRQSFDGPGMLNSNQIDATFGYSHALGPRDSATFSYSFGQFNFDNTATPLQTHSFQVFYGRHLGRRAGLKISAGPQVQVSGQTGGNNPGGHLALTGSADLDYQLRRTHLTLGYLRQTTSGSGVLMGSLVDQVSAGADGQLGRLWHATASVAYAHTSSLGSFIAAPQRDLNALYAVVKIDRRLGRSVDAFAGYGVQVQNSQSGILTTSAYPARHLLTIGLLFHPRSWLLH